MPDANTEAKKDPKRGTEILRIAVESVDRELAFYRSRSGQIYLVALSAEALIIIGKEQLKFENPQPPGWMVPLVTSLAFLGVAVVGTVLGAEYRRRIHQLKANRKDLVEHSLKHHLYPPPEEKRISEIEVLYFVLWFTTVGGCVISFMRSYPSSRYLWALAALYALCIFAVSIKGMIVSMRK